MSQTVYQEIVIDVKDFKPAFNYEQVTRTFSGRAYHYSVPTITLKADNGQTYKLQGKPFARFFGFSKYNVKDQRFGKRKFLEEYRKNGKESVQILLENIWKKIETEKFKLLLVGGNVGRITSDSYIGIPHSFIQQTIENRLRQEGFGFSKEINPRGTIGKYYLDIEGGMSKSDAIANARQTGKVGQMISGMIKYFNINSGDKALGLFGGGVVLACTNGMISEHSSANVKMPHKLDLNVVKRRIEEALGLVIQQLEPAKKEFINLRSIQVTREQAKKKIESLPIPKYLKEAIWARLFQKSEQTTNGQMDFDGTMWGLFMSSTWIASHMDKVRKGNQERELDELKIKQLSSLELFTTDWDAREKELEKTNAPKMEVK